MITFSLLVIGGLNWGLMLFGLDIATWGLPTMLVQVVYALVAISAIFEGVTHKTNCKHCEMGMGEKPMNSGMGQM